MDNIRAALLLINSVLLVIVTCSNINLKKEIKVLKAQVAAEAPVISKLDVVIDGVSRTFVLVDGKVVEK